MKKLLISLALDAALKFIKSEETLHVIEMFLRKLAKSTKTQIDDRMVDWIMEQIRLVLENKKVD